MSTTPTRTRSGSSHIPGRRRPTEFLLPDGRKVLVTLPEDFEPTRQKYASPQQHNPDEAIQVEVVIHGSDEHQTFLRQAQLHHEMRRTALRERLGSDIAEWEAACADLDAVTGALDALADHSTGLNANFSKFGFDARLRTFGDDEEDGGGSGSMRLSRSSSVGSGEIDWNDRRNGTAMKMYKRPIIKQYFHRGLLWRASEETHVFCFELFFDLLYVGIIAINGDHAAEMHNGAELLRFVVTFCITWKMWTDVAQFISWFDVDDILNRVELLFFIACLLGVTLNMLQTFNEEYDTYSQLVGFYLASRVFAAVHYVYTSIMLPLIKGMMLSLSIIILVAVALWIGSIHVEMPARLGLVFAAIFVDLCGSAVPVILFRFARNHRGPVAERISKFYDFFPAINIEHKVERTNAFVTLVLGYSVVGVMYQNAGYGLNAFFGKAVLGMVQAFVFNWLYFEVDGANLHTHAIRRHANTAFLWQYAHLFFIMAYILASAALSKLVLATDCEDADAETLTELYHGRSEPEIALGLRFYYCMGLAIALLSMGAISASHEHKLLRTQRMSKWTRLGNRLAVCVIFFCLPAAQELNSLNLVAITTCLTVWVLIVELWGNSCKEDVFFGGSGCKYTARCGKKELENALAGEDGQADVRELGKSEKTGALDVS